jgi:glycosyltransferase involved in cell wall biosynthesis
MDSSRTAARGRRGRATTLDGQEAAHRLLVFDTSFTFEMIRERSLEDSVTCRDLGGYFEHVWTVHPFATLLTSDGWSPRYGSPAAWEVNATNTFIEGKVGRFAWLRRMFLLNFLLGQIALFFRLRRLVRSEKIDVIRAGDPLYTGLFGWALASVTGAAFVVRVGSNNDRIFEVTGHRANPRLFPSRRVEKRIERFVFRHADLVAGANQDNLDFALANGARPERTTLFRYGNLIDKRHFVEPAARRSDPARYRELGISPKGYLLYVGRLEAVKHPDDVVQVLADLRRRGFDVKAVLAGDGRMRDELVQQARKLGVQDHVVLPGSLGQDGLADLIPNAALILSPHTGRALAEAALGGAPIVAYDIDWQSELVESEVTGLLVPHLARNEMADAAERFLADPAFAAAMGRAVRERALERLDPAALDRHERDQYEALLQRLGRRA